MPTKKGLRKLCDVWGSQAGAARYHDALQRWLFVHGINYEMSEGEDPYGRPFTRYKVHARHLGAAMAVLPAIRELQRGALREAS